MSLGNDYVQCSDCEGFTNSDINNYVLDYGYNIEGLLPLLPKDLKYSYLSCYHCGEVIDVIL